MCLAFVAGTQPVGASLLAKTVDQSTSEVADLAYSRAGSLPLWFCCACMGGRHRGMRWRESYATTR
ncbi:hypothetical protein E3Z29_19520 [Pseudomonas sp. S150]|nr:hypothetical protein E3Z29_19520 [Pseudomonas sp. S150]